MGKKKPKPKPSKPVTAGLESNSVSVPPKTDIEAIAAAICSANQAVFIKVCRLCESKDGPFLNIFDADKVTAKKIDELMPFGIAENDDLPHKICFRCSAKVEELYEFVQRCIKTQHNLNTTMGKKEPIQTKTRIRTIWEEKLNKSNMSNDDICDAMIKKAMAGIKDLPLNPLPLEDEKPVTPVPIKKVSKPKTESPKQAPIEVNNKSDDDASLINANVAVDKFDKKFIPTRSSRSQKPDSLLDGLADYKKPKSNGKPSIDLNKSKENNAPPKKKIFQISSDDSSSETEDSNKKPPSVNKPKAIQETPKPVQPIKPVDPPKPVDTPKAFNIMDHVSMIKVNGVGVLFQCRLCNRNFLKKDVVITHGCAKTGGPKVDVVKPIAPPEPPKIQTVKYINTKTDGELGKPNTSASKSDEIKADVETKTPDIKPKPRIGPASRIKRINNHNSLIGMTVAPITDEKSNVSNDLPVKEPPPKDLPPKDPPVKSMSKSPPETPLTAVPSVQFPTVPSLNSRYKLVPGPNNTFQLVEESSSPGQKTENSEISIKRKTEDVKQVKQESEDVKQVKRKSEDVKQVKRKGEDVTQVENKKSKKISETAPRHKTVKKPDVIELEDPPPPPQRKAEDQPYPVGLFQTLPHHSAIYSQDKAPNPPIFTTPAMKKQSYTIVQTGNPSKLLISTKPQPPVEESSKKRARKSKPISSAQEPFSVTIEDNAQPKDHGFFNFINVDPLLQPSYVLPTDNIIQESQISTSSSVLKATTDNKDKYSCNMCGENFSREKKLLAHIHSHYNKMDEEDMEREKNNKKRRK